jgi:serine/threonine protein kinase
VAPASSACVTCVRNDGSSTTAVNASGPPLQSRVLAGRYRLDTHIANGGMAEVWSATDQVLGRQVAVKILHAHIADDPAMRSRFHAEAVASARLAHPSIVAIFDTCHDDGVEALVMELVRGRTLRDYLDERGRLEPIEVVHIGTEVASALSCAHRAGIIHRDIKPANILLSDDGRVLVTDFGIAKVLGDADSTRTSQLLGTVKYLAPEQVEGGPIDGRADVYALGAVLYEALCGQPPFLADNPAALALARLHRDAPKPSTIVDNVPLDLDRAIVRSLERVAPDRFQSADDFRAALLAAALDGPIASTRPPDETTVVDRDDLLGHLFDPEPAAAPPVRRRSRRRGRYGLVLVVVIILVLLLLALLVAGTELGETLFSSESAHVIAESSNQSG